MKLRAAIRLTSCRCRLGFALFGLALFANGATGQVLSNLQALVRRLPVGNPAVASATDGPKGIACADLDQDRTNDLAIANTDGSVTLYFAKGDGSFSPPVHLASGAGSLRDIVIADLNADGRPDIAVAAPLAERIVVFTNFSTGSRSFALATNVAGWRGVRNLATGDFDGDGRADLLAAGTTNGLRQLRSLGGGNFARVTNLLELASTNADFPKPVYALKAFRPPGAIKDHLIITHADTNRVWLLSPNAAGVLEMRSFVTNRANSHALDVGPLLHPSNGWPDLVTVQRDAGTLEIHAGTGTLANPGFSQVITQRIDVPGGPRAVAIADLNGDGWNDLVVVVRNFDNIVTYSNNNGSFTLATERSVGSSPRALVTGLFDNNAFPDLAVMNNDSSDVSLLMAYPNSVGYRGINHLYQTDGNVVGLIVTNFNGDPYADVILLHRASGDFSVWLANPDGTLQPPVFYTVGNVPAAQVFADVNNDGIKDQITANLGNLGLERGFVTVRLGTSNAVSGLTFGATNRIDLPPGVDGRLFALVPDDFDGDGNLDLAAGFMDSRVAFFRGDGNNDLTYMGPQQFVSQARSMVAGDFDHDGDQDLAGVGISGEVWILENPRLPAIPGMNFWTQPWAIHPYYLPEGATNFGGRKIVAMYYNDDNDLDLIVGSGKGAWLYLGQPGIGFATPPTLLAGTDHFMSDFVVTDLDKDGNQDLIISCRGKDCLSVFTRANNEFFGSGFPINAPASKYIAAGDLDGDRIDDLVGAGGRELWTALSGRDHAPTNTAPLQLRGKRERLTNAVINEILAINTALPVESDGDRLVEWVEIYNGGTRSLSLDGWKLRCTGPNENGVVQTNLFSFRPTFFLGSNGTRLVYFSEPPPRTLHHTGFRLPDDDGTLELMDANGVVVDRVKYPPQRPNISYARFRDGLPAFASNPFPSPLRPNVFNGQLEPDLKFGGVDPSTFRPGTNRFIADVADDVGVSTLTMYYQRLDGQVTQSIPFLDDGEHGDQGVSDGSFAGFVQLQPGAEVQFFFEITGLNDQVTLVPDEPEFGRPGTPGNAYQLALATSPPPLEISELVALNQNGLIDPDSTNHSRPDWVEVRNIGPTNVALDDIVLTQTLGDSSRYHFPTGTVLAPGEHFVVYCDNNPEQGPLHAPFSMKSTGETVMLTGMTTNNSRTLIDWVSFGLQQPDVAWARLGAGGTWRRCPPTPRSGNVAAWSLGLVETNGDDAVFTFAFPTISTNYVVEFTSNLVASSTWTVLTNLTGDGIEKVIRQPLKDSGFFRVRKVP